MEEHVNDILLELVRKTAEFDKQVSKSDEQGDPDLTFQRDESGILWSIDVKTGEKVGRIYEHGDDRNTDTIKEI
ncbi:MAG: hypothetical protein ACI4PO_09045 [Faecousia sp.]